MHSNLGGAPGLRRSDRVVLAVASATFSVLAAMAVIVTLLAAWAWVHFSGEYDVAGTARVVPLLAAVALGIILTTTLVALARVCRLVTRALALAPPDSVRGQWTSASPSRQWRAGSPARPSSSGAAG